MSQKIILKNVRCSYTFINEPRKDSLDQVTGLVSKGKFGVQVLIKKDNPQLKALNDAVLEVAKAEFGEKIKLAMLKTPVRDGDEERDSEEYNDHFFLNASGSRKPGLVNRYNKEPTEDDIQEMCYSGSIFTVSLSIYAYKAESGRGVAVGLNNVMLREAGVRLDGLESAESAFEGMGDEAAIALPDDF